MGALQGARERWEVMIWMDIAIPALVTCGALALLEAWTLWNWHRDRRMSAMLIDHDTENKQLRTERKAWEARAHEVEEERNEWQEQLDKALTREKAAQEQRRLVQEHLDALS